MNTEFGGAKPSALVESAAPAGSAGTRLPHKNLMEAMRRSDGLLDRATAALRRTIAADPEDATALLRLGDMYRGLGKLRAALECYRQAASLRPSDPKALRLAAMLSGERLPDAPPGTRPLPFVHMADFLPPRQCSALLALALASRERFEPGPVFASAQRAGAGGEDGRRASVGDTVVDLSKRRCLVVERGIVERDVRPWFEARVRLAFAQALPRMRMREPSKYWVEMRMSAYLPGGFFSKHRDDSALSLRSRKVGFVYFFHRQPRRFSGGDLLLYDGDGTRSFTQFEPRHNSIVLSPAACVHEVVPVESDSEDFADARFAIHGWLRTHSAEESLLQNE